jgi:N-acyl-phosphatidylethanolamine-hydrolysing phospholipase D
MSFLSFKIFARFLVICPVLAALFIFNSCQTFLDVGDNIGRHFSTPQKVKNKIENPIRDNVKLSALWVGHSTFLIQIYDKVILLDPLLTNNVAEVLRRYVEPGLDLNSVKKIDMILLSHPHMDHLSLGSLNELEDKFPGADLVFPKGLEEFLPKYDFKYYAIKQPVQNQKSYIGQSQIIDSVKITSVSALHWGGRYGIDGKLWKAYGFCGFIIQYKDVTVYYTGDTSYDEKLFRYIGDNYNIDLEIVNIIYCNECSEINEGSTHIYPMGAIQILDKTKARYMIPAHYGLFADPDAQGRVLEKMYLTNNEYKSKVRVLKTGEQFTIENKNLELIQNEKAADLNK